MVSYYTEITEYNKDTHNDSSTSQSPSTETETETETLIKYEDVSSKDYHTIDIVDSDDEEEEECPICLESVTTNSNKKAIIRFKNCGHSLHYLCVNKYIQNSVEEYFKQKCRQEHSDNNNDNDIKIILKCPICRQDILEDGSSTDDELKELYDMHINAPHRYSYNISTTSQTTEDNISTTSTSELLTRSPSQIPFYPSSMRLEHLTLNTSDRATLSITCLYKSLFIGFILSYLIYITYPVVSKHVEFKYYPYNNTTI